MYRNLFIIIIVLFFIQSCAENKKQEYQQKINGTILKELVEEALWGSNDANNELWGLVNSNTPSPDKYNRISIDSTVTDGTKKLYSVLIENPNPMHNILAVYDENLNLLLLDNSLNGNFTSEWKNLSGRQYLIASEDFISKDILKLSRLSLYTMLEDKLYLVFRSFTRLDKAGKLSQQNINQITGDRIVTDIQIHNGKIKHSKDDFELSASDKKFISQKNTFDKFVINEINNAKWDIEKPELTIETIQQKQPEIKSETQVADEEVKADTKGYKIYLDASWDKPVSVAVTEQLISKLEGVRYINEKIGTQLTVIKLPEGSNALQFIKYKFGQPTRGNYSVRSTGLIESGNNYIQFYEHSCENKAYILLLQTPKHTYVKNKLYLNDITTSFFIEC